MIDRISRLAQVLSEEGIDAYLACTPISMGYLADLFEDGHERMLLLAIRNDGSSRLICPALTTNQAARVGIKDIRAWADGESPTKLFTQLAEDWHLASGIIGVDAEMRADILLELQQALPAALFKSGDSSLSRLTRRKEGLEIELLSKAASIADQAFEIVRRQVRAGQTEREVSDLLASAMQKLGGKPTFSIVAAGANSAEPHHLGDDTRITSGDVVLLDFGCSVQGYQSDITRVMAVDSVDPEAKAVYETVYAAHMAGRHAARAGATSDAVDRACREVIADAGYGEQFVHRTGHGVGMRGHEAPYIAPGNDFVLEEGNCFSIEPGIYLAGKFGIRIENIVVAQDQGSLSLNAEPSPTLELPG